MGRIATRHSSESRGKAGLKSAPRFLVRSLASIWAHPYSTYDACECRSWVKNCLAGRWLARLLYPQIAAASTIRHGGS
jgi:hypothetical protein